MQNHVKIKMAASRRFVREMMAELRAIFWLGAAKSTEKK